MQEIQQNITQCEIACSPIEMCIIFVTFQKQYVSSAYLTYFKTKFCLELMTWYTCSLILRQSEVTIPNSLLSTSWGKDCTNEPHLSMTC